jgi:hypothetical protein
MRRLALGRQPTLARFCSTRPIAAADVWVAAERSKSRGKPGAKSGLGPCDLCPPINRNKKNEMKRAPTLQHARISSARTYTVAMKEAAAPSKLLPATPKDGKGFSPAAGQTTRTSGHTRCVLNQVPIAIMRFVQPAVAVLPVQVIDPPFAPPPPAVKVPTHCPRGATPVPVTVMTGPAAMVVTSPYKLGNA